MFAASVGVSHHVATAATATVCVPTATQTCPPPAANNPPPAANNPPAATTPPTPPAATTPPAANNPPPATNPPAATHPPATGNNNNPPRDQAGDFQFDPNLHHRRHQRDNVFRFFFNGYFYDRPYWQQRYYQQQHYGLVRLSCAEGRRLVADNGYNRVRILTCNGFRYTYQAHRGGFTYRVFVNARRGTIVGRSRLY